MRWLMLKAWVAEDRAMSVTRETVAASGVPTVKVAPHASASGAEARVGRGPLKR
jgi:hypothetical protein